MFDNATAPDGSKVCRDCGRLQPLSQFWPNKTYRDGRINTCRDCKKPYSADWRARHSESLKAKQKRESLARLEARVANGLPIRQPKTTKEGRLCSRCKKRKSPTEFALAPSQKDGLGAYCRPCAAVMSKQWRDNNKERYRSYAWQWEKSRKYRLDRATFEEMLLAQEGKCAICQRLFDTNTKASTVHIDHDHNTLLVRGLLCNHCNQGLGHFRDSPDVLRRAASYLERKRR